MLVFTSVTTAIADDAVPLIWKTETTTGYRISEAVASGQGYVASAGNHYSDSCGVCGYDAALQVQSAVTGKMAWSVNYDLHGTSDTNVAVAIADGVVVTAGWSYGNATSGHYWWVVSGYSLASGAVLWRDVLGDASTDYLPSQIALQGGRVYVTGTAGATCVTVDVTTCDLYTRVYDIAKGTVVYSIRDDASHGGNDEAYGVAVDGQRMFIGGQVGVGPNGEATASIQAYDAASGRLVWTDVIEDTTHDSRIYKVVTTGDQVIATGRVNDDWILRAYDAATGEIRWTQTYSLLGSSIPGVYNSPFQLATDGNTVVAAGYGSTQVYGTEEYPGASRDWVARAYDVGTGALLWSDHSGSTTDEDEANGGVVLLDGRAYVLGYLHDLIGSTHTLLRSYDSRTGQVIWNDSQTRESSPTGTLSVALSTADGELNAVSYVLGTRPVGTPPPDGYGDDVQVDAYKIGPGR